ncbi:MAG: GGDEF domain-containing protein [Spirochaetales bacterium]|nr:GGDEF domain-containing protein [Spirochaetales bacterium]
MNQKRPVIGFQINTLFGSYQEQLLKGVLDEAKLHDVNLLVIPAGFFPPVGPYFYQYEVINHFITKKNLDGLIMATGTLFNYSVREEMYTFIKNLSPMPIVSLSVALKGIPSILIDNKSGIREIMEHLILFHGFKKIAFIKGAENNTDAEERFDAYLESLERHQIEPDPDIIIPGDFTREAGIAAGNKLYHWTDKIQAIVAANDDMAVYAMETLTKLGVDIPGQCAVTGFDDRKESQYIRTPLTTVNQPAEQQAREALRMAAALVKGEKVPERIVLPTRMIIRASCGCYSGSIVALNSEGSSEGAGKIKTENLIPGVTSDPARVKKLTAQVSRLFDKYGKGSGNKKNGSTFIKEFNTLIDKNRDWIGLKSWQHILSLAYGNLRKKPPASGLQSRYEILFHQARILVSENLNYSQGKKNLEMILELDRLRDGILNVMIRSTFIEDLLDELASTLPQLGVGSCYIVLYEMEITHKLGMQWKFPANAEMVLAYNEKGRKKLSRKQKQMCPVSRLPFHLMPGDRRTSLIICDLFFSEEQFGYALFEAGFTNFTFLETIRLQICNALKVTRLIKEGEKAEIRLKSANRKLKKSLTDQFELNTALTKAKQKLDEVNEKLKQLSITDELSGVYNRRYFNEKFMEEFQSALRLKKRLAILILDIDYFKKINDRYGHKAGDLCISTIAQKIQRSLNRRMDILMRYGGDEFIILLFDSTKEGVGIVAERIRAGLAAEPVVFEATEISVTVSIGCASVIPQKGMNPEDLFVLADTSLYEAKETGRNRVVVKSIN